MKTQRITIRISQPDLKKLEDLSLKEANCSVSKLVRRFVDKGLRDVYAKRSSVVRDERTIDLCEEHIE